MSRPAPIQLSRSDLDALREFRLLPNLTKIPLFLETEQTAMRIRVVETEVMPGLLQTPEYLQALQDAQLPMPDEVAQSWRALRTKRQEMLYSRRVLPRLEFVIGKAAIVTLLNAAAILAYVMFVRRG